jgi:glutaredoxin
MAGSLKTVPNPRTLTSDIAYPFVVVLLSLAIGTLPGCEKSFSGSRALSALTRLFARQAVAAAPRADADENETDSARTSDEESTARRGSQRQPRIIEVGDVSTLDESDDSKAVFSYVDSRGGTHIVKGLYQVPEAFRATAKNHSNGATRGINRYDAMAAVRKQRPRTESAVPDFNPNRLDVTVFSATWCGACRRAKQLLDSEGISYEDRDIDDDPSARAEVKSMIGRVAIPLIDINGTYVVGYDRKTITQLIAGG